MNRWLGGGVMGGAVGCGVGLMALGGVGMGVGGGNGLSLLPGEGPAWVGFTATSCPVIRCMKTIIAGCGLMRTNGFSGLLIV